MEPLKIDITILQPLQKVWDLMIDPKHIMKWNFAHESWHCPKAENDFQVGGKLKTRMEAKDGSFVEPRAGRAHELPLQESCIAQDKLVIAASDIVNAIDRLVFPRSDPIGREAGV